MKGRPKKVDNQPEAAARPEPRPFAQPPHATGSLAFVVADYLTAEIQRGVYPPGAKLPSQRDLCDLCNVSDTTTKAALAELVKRDMVEARDRIGYFVRDLRDTHIDTDSPAPGRYPGPNISWTSRSSPLIQRREATAPPRPFAARITQELPIQSSLSPAHTRIASLDVRGEIPAPDIAVILRMTPDPQAPIIARHRLITDIHGTPVELRSSYMPAHLADRTPLAGLSLLDGLWPQLIGTHTGHQPQSTRAYLQARIALDFEAQALGISAHAMVIVRDTALYPTPDLSGPALDLTRSILPAETTRIVYANRL